MKRMAWAAFVVIVVFLAAHGVPSIQASAASAAVAKPVSGGIVVLLRGGMNIFSTGMDELELKLRAAGIDARSEPHADWPKLAAEARQRYVKSKKPFVLIGHSWGALAAVLLASELNKSGTPVDLMILYDTTQAVKISANVRHVINFISSTGIGLGFTATGLNGPRQDRQHRCAGVRSPQHGQRAAASPAHGRRGSEVDPSWGTHGGSIDGAARLIDRSPWPALISSAPKET